MVTVNYNFLCRNRKRLGVFLVIISQHANGCYLFCLLIVISLLFPLNLNMQSIVNEVLRYLSKIFWRDGLSSTGSQGHPPVYFFFPSHSLCRVRANSFERDLDEFESK